MTPEKRLAQAAAVAAPDGRHAWELRLYVAGQSDRSAAAFRNLQILCKVHLAGRYRIEVIDLLKTPQLSREDQIVAVPTLVRKLPFPIRKVIGDLSDTERTLVGLQLRPVALKKEQKTIQPTCEEGDPDHKDASPPRYRLRLYVSGATLRSTQAIANITSIAEQRLQGRYELEVIDAFQQAELVRNQQIVVLPTLIKHLPLPVRRIAGDLSNEGRVLLGLGLTVEDDDGVEGRNAISDPDAQ